MVCGEPAPLSEVCEGVILVGEWRVVSAAVSADSELVQVLLTD